MSCFQKSVILCLYVGNNKVSCILQGYRKLAIEVYWQNKLYKFADNNFTWLKKRFTLFAFMINNFCYVNNFLISSVLCFSFLGYKCHCLGEHLIYYEKFYFRRFFAQVWYGLIQWFFIFAAWKINDILCTKRK